MHLYFVMFYGVREGRLVSDVHTTADTLDQAMEAARRASLESPEPNDHYAVEGGDIENGSWDNPVFAGGKRIR